MKIIDSKNTKDIQTTYYVNILIKKKKKNRKDFLSKVVTRKNTNSWRFSFRKITESNQLWETTTEEVPNVCLNSVITNVGLQFNVISVFRWHIIPGQGSLLRGVTSRHTVFKNPREDKIDDLIRMQVFSYEQRHETTLPLFLE